MWANNSPELSITGVSFSGNTAAQNGGGWASHAVDAGFTNCAFNENIANVSIANGQQFGGGAMWLVASSPFFNDVTFSDNSTPGSGGGIFLLHDGTAGSSPTLENVMFSGNTASSNGGGISIHSGCSPVLSNCFISGNTATVIGAILGDNLSTFLFSPFTSSSL